MSSDELDTLLRRYFDTQPDLVSLYLFGSRAEGRAHAESDVDVAVLIDQPCRTRAWSTKRVDLLSSLIESLRTDLVDLVVLNDAPPELARRITRGIRIACRDDLADRAFVRDAQLRAADLDPFLRRMRQLRKARLSR